MQQPAQELGKPESIQPRRAACCKIRKRISPAHNRFPFQCLGNVAAIGNRVPCSGMCCLVRELLSVQATGMLGKNDDS
jgi:hypothetical protein